MTGTTALDDLTVPSASPPKPVFALSIGVVGHRLDRLPKKDDARYLQIETEVERVLKEIRLKARDVCDVYADFFADELQSSLMLRLVTALAEGTDTIAAEAGCSIGYRLEGDIAV